MIKINFIKTKRSFRKNNILPDANFYWTIIFYSWLVLTVSALAFALYIFTGINSEEEAIPQGENPQLTKISRERVMKVLKAFNDREKATEVISNSPGSLVDPSL